MGFFSDIIKAGFDGLVGAAVGFVTSGFNPAGAIAGGTAAFTKSLAQATLGTDQPIQRNVGGGVPQSYVQQSYMPVASNNYEKQEEECNYHNSSGSYITYNDNNDNKRSGKDHWVHGNHVHHYHSTARDFV